MCICFLLFLLIVGVGGPTGGKQRAVDTGPRKCYKLVKLLVNCSTKANPEGRPWLHSDTPSGVKERIKMDNYTAMGICEGFIENDSEDQLLEAWQHLIDTGLAWQLQGWFGRTAADLIERGFCKATSGKLGAGGPTGGKRQA